MVRLLAIVLFFAAAGMVLFGPKRQEGTIHTVNTRCFDDSQSNETRIKACAVNYEAGHNKSHEALDQLLSLYAQNDNFNEGAQRVNAAIEGGLDAPRWLFWQAYFNEKRSVDQPPMTELIAQTKDHPDFLRDIREVWANTEDKRYVMPMLEQVNATFTGEFWVERLNAILVFYFVGVKDAFPLYEKLFYARIDKPAEIHEIIPSFLIICLKHPDDCPKLKLTKQVEKPNESCETHLEFILDTEENLNATVENILGESVTVAEAYNDHNTRWFKASESYADSLGVIFSAYDEAAIVKAARRLLSLEKVMICSQNIIKDQYLKLYLIKKINRIESGLPQIERENFNEYLWYILEREKK